MARPASGRLTSLQPSRARRISRFRHLWGTASLLSAVRGRRQQARSLCCRSRAGRVPNVLVESRTETRRSLNDARHPHNVLGEGGVARCATTGRRSALDRLDVETQIDASKHGPIVSAQGMTRHAGGTKRRRMIHVLRNLARSRQGRWLGVALTITVMGVVGCGGDDGDAAGSTAPSSAESDSSASGGRRMNRS